jgi:predicted transglutaminase-like cysteine proteinase
MRTYVAAVALAITLPAPVMATQSGTAAPVGFQIMCLRNPTECQGGGADRIHLDTATLTHLDRVNRAVNKAITPRADGQVDRWKNRRGLRRLRAGKARAVGRRRLSTQRHAHRLCEDKRR